MSDASNSTPDPDAGPHWKQHRRVVSLNTRTGLSLQTRNNADASISKTANTGSHAEGQSGQALDQRRHSSAHALSAPTSATIGLSKVKSRGKDWESFSLDRAEKVDAPWLRSSGAGLREVREREHSSQRNFKLPDIAIERPRGHPDDTGLQYSGLGPDRRPLATHAAKLSLSSILHVHTSPTASWPQKHGTDIPPPPDLNSPSSLGPCSSRSSSYGFAPSPQPSQQNNTLLPKYMSAFEYAMRPYLDSYIDAEEDFHLPWRLHSVSESTLEPSSPRSDEISYTKSPTHFPNDEENQNYDIPASLQSHRLTPFRLLALRTHLLRCTTLHLTLTYLQHKPWLLDPPNKPAYWYFSKIRFIAKKARRYAEVLQSCGAKARCEFWIGVGFAGTKDWESAERHFWEAVMWDDGIRKESMGKARSLGAKERADVQCLYEDVKKRAAMWRESLERRKERMVVMGYELVEGGEDGEADRCFEGGGAGWMPKRDWMLRNAGDMESDDEDHWDLKASTVNRFFGEPVMEEMKNQEPLPSKSPTWATFTREEKRYIKLGVTRPKHPRS